MIVLPRLARPFITPCRLSLPSCRPLPLASLRPSLSSSHLSSFPTLMSAAPRRPMRSIVLSSLASVRGPSALCLVSSVFSVLFPFQAIILLLFYDLLIHRHRVLFHSLGSPLSLSGFLSSHLHPQDVLPFTYDLNLLCPCLLQPQCVRIPTSKPETRIFVLASAVYRFDRIYIRLDFSNGRLPSRVPV
jgi:hypothetical protein